MWVHIKWFDLSAINHNINGKAFAKLSKIIFHTWKHVF